MTSCTVSNPSGATVILTSKVAMCSVPGTDAAYAAPALAPAPRRNSASAPTTRIRITPILARDSLLFGHDLGERGERIVERLARHVDDHAVDVDVGGERRDIVVADRGTRLVTARDATTGVCERHGRELTDLADTHDDVVDAQLAFAASRFGAREFEGARVRPGRENKIRADDIAARTVEVVHVAQPA